MKAAINIYPYVLHEIRSRAHTQEGKQYRQLNQDISFLEQQTQQWLLSGGDKGFEDMANEHTERIFKTKFRIVQWVSATFPSIDFLYSKAELELPRPSEFDQPEVLAVLDNLHFALRTSKKLHHALMDSAVPETELDQMLQHTDIGRLSFKNIKTMLLLVENPMVHHLLYFMEKNLLLELTLIAAFLVLENHQKYDPARINDLSWVLADTVQEIGAGAMRLGVFDYGMPPLHEQRRWKPQKGSVTERISGIMPLSPTIDYDEAIAESITETYEHASKNSD